MARTATTTRSREKVVAAKKPPIARSATGLSLVRKSKNWWEGAAEPDKTSSVQLARALPDKGGDYLSIKIGKADGEQLFSRGADRLSLEAIKRRTVVLAIHKAGQVERRWGLHKIRLAKNLKPHVHFSVDDEKYRTVESKVDQNEIEMKFDGDRVTFELPPSIR